VLIVLKIAGYRPSDGTEGTIGAAQAISRSRSPTLTSS
jgi:hypothetical protein